MSSLIFILLHLWVLSPKSICFASSMPQIISSPVLGCLALDYEPSLVERVQNFLWKRSF